MNQNFFATNQIQADLMNSTNNMNNSLNQQLQQGQLQQRSVTPPKRPAVLCRKSSNTASQNLLLQSSNNKHLVNMPSPIYQNNQMWINSNNNQQEMINQSSSIQLCNPNYSNMMNMEGSTASNSLIQKNSSTNSSMIANNCIPPNNTQGQDNKSSNPNQMVSKKNDKDQCAQIGNSSHSFGNTSIQQQTQEQSFEKCKAWNHLKSNNMLYAANNSEYMNQEIMNQQMSAQNILSQPNRNNPINEDQSILNNSMFTQANFLPGQGQTNNKNSQYNNQESNVSSIKQEIGVIRQQSNHQQINQLQQSQQQQQFQQQLQQYQLDQSAKSSHKVMMQLSEEIERMNNELKNKNKEYLLLSEKYDLLLDDIKFQEVEYQNTLQAKDLMLQQQLQISQRDQVQISTLLQEIERLTEVVKDFPKEQAKAETNGEIRQKIDKLIQMNENLLIENKELGDENTQQNQEMKQYKQEIENLKKIISEQAQAVQSLQKKNEKILFKYQKFKGNQENNSKEEKSKPSSGQGDKNAHQQYQRQIQSYDEEIDSIKYLLKEKIQEIEYWKCKAQSYQNDYEELEQRLHTALKSNEILNNRIMKFSQINFLDSVSKEMLSQSQDKQENKTENKIGEIGGEDESEQEFDAEKDNNSFFDDRYKQLANRLSGAEADYEQSEINNFNNPYRKSRYGITSSQYQNRIQEFQNNPLQEFKNSITLRKQNYFTNETVDSDQILQSKASKNKK